MIKPEVLVWTRTSAGYSLLDAAAALKIAEDRLAEWEAGTDAPSIPQLRKLAGLYKRPLAVFYLQEVPTTDFQVIRDLRRLPGTGLRRYSPDLLLEVRRATQQRALAIEMLEELGESSTRFSLSATLADDPEMVGARIRDALSISRQDQARWHDREGRVALNAWRTRIEGIGALVFQATRFSSEEASGFAIANDLLPVIVINRKDAPMRRTFSLLHEMAHLMLRISGVSELDVDAARPPEDQAIEVYCNRVAAAALMPRDWILSEPLVTNRPARSTNWTDGEIAELAQIFSVSREALLRRLLTFERTTENFYRLKRQQYRAEFEAAKARLAEDKANTMKRNMPQETVSNLGRPLVQMILDNYRQNNLTLSDVAGYLGIKTKHISKLELIAAT